MTCILQSTLEKEFVNDHGIAKIIPHWNEDAVRECPDCGGIKYLQFTNDVGYRMMAPCQGTYALARIDAYNRAGIPARFMNAEFGNYNIHRLRESSDVTMFIDGIKNFQKGATGFLLEGGPGTGKTHLLCAAIRYLTLELGISCKYIDYSNLLSDIRASYSQNIPESVHIEPLASVPVLFIDELGKGRDKKNDFEIRIIDEIINRRYLDPDLTTLFASNYRDRSTSGYNNYLAAGYGVNAKKWDTYAKDRSKSEQFPSVDAFNMYVDQLMKTDHIEDRISERTASRILSMASAMFINASDYRRNAGK